MAKTRAAQPSEPSTTSPSTTGPSESPGTESPRTESPRTGPPAPELPPTLVDAPPIAEPSAPDEAGSGADPIESAVESIGQHLRTGRIDIARKTFQQTREQVGADPALDRVHREIMRAEAEMPTDPGDLGIASRQAKREQEIPLISLRVDALLRADDVDGAVSVITQARETFGSDPTLDKLEQRVEEAQQPDGQSSEASTLRMKPLDPSMPPPPGVEASPLDATHVDGQPRPPIAEPTPSGPLPRPQPSPPPTWSGAAAPPRRIPRIAFVAAAGVAALLLLIWMISALMGGSGDADSTEGEDGTSTVQLGTEQLGTEQLGGEQPNQRQDDEPGAGRVGDESEDTDRGTTTTTQPPRQTSDRETGRATGQQAETQRTRPPGRESSAGTRPEREQTSPPVEPPTGDRTPNRTQTGRRISAPDAAGAPAGKVDTAG